MFVENGCHPAFTADVLYEVKDIMDLFKSQREVFIEKIFEHQKNLVKKDSTIQSFEKYLVADLNQDFELARIVCIQ